MKLLFVSTPVGALGSGIGGGVELSLYNLAQEMIRRGHSLQILAPADSTLDDLPIVQISGNLQIIAQSLDRSAAIAKHMPEGLIAMPKNSVLANMWDYVRQVESEYDLIVNFAYDWLPFYLTSFLKRPVAHFVSMGSLSDAVDEIIVQTSKQFRGTLGFYTPQQVATFPELTPPIYYLSSGIDLSLYQFCGQPKQQLAWLGRISPEKGLEDGLAVANGTNISLMIMGKIQDEAYWQKVQQDYPNAPFEYLGFLSTREMQQVLREAQGLIMTPRWVEAFGNVAIEALACGVPVISYTRGGPASIIQDGKTGFLVEPDNIAGLIEATKRLGEINRQTCRNVAQTEFSLEALGERYENWFIDILNFRL